LTKAGLEVLIEIGAGAASGWTDEAYAAKGARLASDRQSLFKESDILLQVRYAGANAEAGREDLPQYRPGQVVIGMAEPLSAPEWIETLAQRGVTTFALELLPRISRAQSMDVLSSMATVAGYRAVLLAAQASPKMFPMLMTAAGTLTPAKVFVVGAGVAGLQAIATARRLGAAVSAYDVRSAVKDQVKSLGAKFVEMDLDTGAAEGQGGYAKAMDETFYQRQRELLAKVVAESDVVITTAVIPGKPAPVLITAAMLAGMSPGAVIVDLAAERGGNCEVTVADKAIVRGGVAVLGPTNLVSEAPVHASQMYSKNVTTFLLNLIKNGQLNLDLSDEIIRETLLTRDGRTVNPRLAPNAVH
jgi:NAD(P) transhydrogenase subunit alpha